MFNCSKEILIFYKEKVALPESEKDEMRDRRDTNRKKLRDALSADDKPSLIGMWTQGSYAMHTMVQSENNDFDIDDGVYFKKEDLINEDNNELSPKEVKKIVKDTIYDARHLEPAKIKNNCVRIKYAKGYHIDIPVYRTSKDKDDNDLYELAAANEWKKSDPRAVTKWFKDAVSEKSPDETNGRQLRRIVRMLKDYVKKNAKSSDKIPSGLIISKLVVEEYEAHKDRDDEALYYTMKNIRNRLNSNLEVEHPITFEKLTSDTNDLSTIFFRDKLSSSLDELDILFSTEDSSEALSAWGKIFKDNDPFAEQASVYKKNEHMNNNKIITSFWNKSEEEILAVNKVGGGRNA